MKERRRTPPSRGPILGRFLRESLLSGASFAAFGVLCAVVLGFVSSPMDTLVITLGGAVAGTVGVGAWWLVCGRARRYSIGRCIGAGVLASLLCNPVLPLAMIVVQLRRFRMDDLDILIPYSLMFLVVGWFTLPAGIAASLIARKLVVGRLLRRWQEGDPCKRGWDSSEPGGFNSSDLD